MRKEREVESELGMSVVGMERKGRVWARGIHGPWHLRIISTFCPDILGAESGDAVHTSQAVSKAYLVEGKICLVFEQHEFEFE